jgi:hypothetical protein
MRDLPVLPAFQNEQLRRRAGRVSPVARIVIVLWLVALTAARPPLTVMSPNRNAKSRRRSRSCHHLGEHLLGGELVPVGAVRVLADGGDKLAELVVASDPELNPAGAAADVPG